VGFGCKFCIVARPRWDWFIGLYYLGDDLFNQAKKKPTHQEVGWFYF
jgi:hypothetical protein